MKQEIEKQTCLVFSVKRDMKFLMEARSFLCSFNSFHLFHSNQPKFNKISSIINSVVYCVHSDDKTKWFLKFLWLKHNHSTKHLVESQFDKYSWQLKRERETNLFIFNSFYLNLFVKMNEWYEWMNEDSAMEQSVWEFK